MQTLILLNLRKIRKLVNFMRIPFRPIVNTYFWFNVNTDSGLIVNTFRAISGMGVHRPGITVHVEPETLPTH